MEVSPALVVSGLSLIGSAASLYWSWQSRSETRHREIVDSISDMHTAAQSQRDLLTVTQLKIDKVHLSCIDLSESSDMKAPLMKRVEEQLNALTDTGRQLDEMDQLLEQIRTLQSGKMNPQRLARKLHELKAEFRRLCDRVGNRIKTVDATAELIQVAEQRYRGSAKISFDK
jgi:hypothetical protein